MATKKSVLVRAYGDRQNDGMVQMSFVLPVAGSALGREAAKAFATQHGLYDPLVSTMEEAAPGYTYFVVYGTSKHAVDLAALRVPEQTQAHFSREEIETRLRERRDKPIVVVGACTGNDAHTVGIDAILNYKGYGGDKGLESYKGFHAHNLGAQVQNEELTARAHALGADAILVSQVITQRNCHKENAAALVDMLQRQGRREHVLLLLGGPRIDSSLALELGYDQGFGPGTKPIDVASFLVARLCP